MKLIVHKETREVLTAVRDDLPEGFAPPEGYDLLEADPAAARKMKWIPQAPEPPDIETRLRRIEMRLGL